MANRVSVEVSANVQGFQQGMQAASQSAQQYETDMRKVSDSTVNFNQELRKAKREAQNLAAGYAKLDAAAKQSAFGQEMKRQLDAAKQAAADYIDMQGDLQQELRNMASDTKALDALAEGIGIIGDVTSTALGIVAQFTGNEEDAQRAVVAFTTATSAANSAIKIANALQPYSNTMKKIGTLQDMAAAAAIKIKTAAEGKSVITTKAATAAQAAFNKIAAMNPYVLLAMAIVGVVAAIGTFIAFTGDAEDAEDKMQKEIEETNKRLEEQRDQLLQTSGSMYNTASRLDHLYAEYLQTNNEIRKTEILTEAAAEFKKLGMEVNNLADAQRILKEHGNDVIELIRLQGDAAAITAMRFEAFKKSMKMLMEEGYTVSAARILAGSNEEVMKYDKELDNLNAKAAKLNKKLNIKPKVFKETKTTTKTTTKTEVVVEDGSLQKLKDELANLEKKKINLNIKGESLKKLQKEIDDKKKEIEDKEIELGIRAKRGSLEDITKQISEIDDKIKKLDPVLDEVEIKKLQMDKQVLEEAKKEIEDKFKEVVITGKGFKSDAQQGSVQWSRDKVSYLKQMMDIEVDDDRYQYWLKRYKEEKKNLEALEIKVEADLDETQKGSLEWLSKKKQKYQAILETSVVGSPEWKDALANINKLTKEENNIQLAIEVSGMSALEKTFNMLDGFHAIDNIVGSFENLTSAIGENKNAWEIFMAAISTFESIMEGINTVTAIYNLLSAKSAATKIAEAAASGSAAAATSTQAAAEGTAVAPTTAATIANKALEASYLDLASAMIFAAHAYIPFAGVGIAAGFISSMLAIQAATKATTMSMMAFAEGGIVGGSSYSGDRILARVNSGEMILNDKQQRHLFELLDSDAMPQKGGTNVTVQGVIRGTDLLLVQKNTNKVRSKSGTQIHF